MRRRHHILIIDDEPANLRLLKRILDQDYNVFTALSGIEGIEILHKQEIELIICDQRMPGMTGVEVLEASLTIRPLAVKILLTGYSDIQALIEAINLGHIYKYLQKPWDIEDLKLTVKRALEACELREHNEQLVKELQAALEKLDSLATGTIQALASALDAKCDYTSGHSLRVSKYAVAIGRKLGLSDAELKDIEVAGILHDIGKIGVPESILWKPEKLDTSEQAIMAIHPVRSAKMIEDIPVLNHAASWIKHHHEYLDGSGYPDHLCGDAIPLGSRIVLVADAFDAMVSDRPYRKAIGYERATEELRKYSGRQFDPRMVEALLAAISEKGDPFTIVGISESFLGVKLNSVD